jgi:hypothetical protein
LLSGVVAEDDQTDEKRVAGTKERKHDDEEHNGFESAEQKDDDPHDETACSKDEDAV